MKKVLFLLIILFTIVFITGCGKEEIKGPKLVCTKQSSEQLLQGKTTLTIQYNEQGKAADYHIDSDFTVLENIYESYGDKKEDNMKTINDKIVTEIQKGYEQYEPKVDNTINGNNIKVQLTVNNNDFLKTISTIEKEKEAAESELGKFQCTIQKIK